MNEIADEKNYQFNLYELSEITTKEHAFKQNKNRKTAPIRRHKTFKQMIMDEQKYLQTKKKFDDLKPTYVYIVSPPSLKPHKRYCDITGLSSYYTNPSNGLRFFSVEIYSTMIKNMSPGLDQEFLELRGANVILK